MVLPGMEKKHGQESCILNLQSTRGEENKFEMGDWGRSAPATEYGFSGKAMVGTDISETIRIYALVLLDSSVVLYTASSVPHSIFLSSYQVLASSMEQD
ncbi:hypothetical protein RHS02_04359, partial [Rhizoctonia solani]